MQSQNLNKKPLKFILSLLESLTEIAVIHNHFPKVSFSSFIVSLSSKKHI